MLDVVKKQIIKSLTLIKHAESRHELVDVAYSGGKLFSFQSITFVFLIDSFSNEVEKNIEPFMWQLVKSVASLLISIENIL